MPEEKVTGREYRLPTEAEWEYACRAGSSTRYCFGDSADGLGGYAWFIENSGRKTHPVGRKTHPVGKKKPNSWGLYDMHGNVCEWCQDWFGGGYYEESPREDPMCSTTGVYRVYRGGGWGIFPKRCRSADRSGSTPDIRSTNLGFRMALDPAE